MPAYSMSYCRPKEEKQRIWRAKILGELVVGHPDPGAISTYNLLKYMSEYVNNIQVRGKKNIIFHPAEHCGEISCYSTWKS